MEESTRIVFDHFDEGLARQFIADAQDVLALVFAVILHSFPAGVPVVRADPDLFADCPQVRALLPSPSPAGGPRSIRGDSPASA